MIITGDAAIAVVVVLSLVIVLLFGVLVWMMLSAVVKAWFNKKSP